MGRRMIIIQQSANTEPYLEHDGYGSEKVVVLVVGDVGPDALVVRTCVQQVASLQNIFYPLGLV